MPSRKNGGKGMRRVRNMCENIDPEEFKKIMSNFMNQLRISGYNIKYRIQLLNGILKLRSCFNIESHVCMDKPL